MWSSMHTSIDAFQPTCWEHYTLPGKSGTRVQDVAAFNGNHVVLTGQLELSIGIDVTAYVDAFIAGAEFRVHASGSAVLNTAFTRINKCWTTMEGDTRTGFADGFATVTTATVDFELS